MGAMPKLVQHAHPLGYEKLLTEEEACERLQISPGSLRWLMRKKEITVIKVGRGINRFRPADLERFINSKADVTR